LFHSAGWQLALDFIAFSGRKIAKCLQLEMKYGNIAGFKAE
jgi:hypothetical protein